MDVNTKIIKKPSELFKNTELFFFSKSKAWLATSNIVNPIKASIATVDGCIKPSAANAKVIE